MTEQYQPRFAATVQESSKAEAERPKKFVVGLFNEEIRVVHVGQKTKQLGCSSSFWPTMRKSFRKFIEMALAGDRRCMHLYVDRLLPRRNGRPVDIELPAITNMHDVVTAMAAITTGVNDGSLTAEEASQLVHTYEGYAKFFEMHDLAARLENDKSRIKKRP